MPELDGLKCLERIMIEQPCPVVMVSSLTASDAETTLEAIRMGAVDFIAKPSGALSLSMPEIAGALVQKVRAAAGAKLRTSPLLAERVRHRLRSGVPAPIERPRPSPRPVMSEPSVATGDGVVLIGTSTGGPPALEAVLSRLPDTFPWPIVIAQHMPAAFTGSLATRLDRLCAITVVEVTSPTRLEPGYAYIGRGDADIILSRRNARLIALPAPPDGDYPWHPSTDRLVRTAMKHVPSGQLIGILMTGMGNDGAEAMAQLHMAGGRTIAESEETAVVWGMPGELVRAAGAEWILPLPEIPSFLQKLVP
jgi:two-component system chemotaxis response regulator CheB